MLLTPVLFIVYDKLIAPRFASAQADEADEIDDEFSDDDTLTEEAVEDVDEDKDDEDENGETSKSSKSKRKNLLRGIDLPKLGRSGSKKKHKVRVHLNVDFKWLFWLF